MTEAEQWTANLLKEVIAMRDEAVAKLRSNQGRMEAIVMAPKYKSVFCYGICFWWNDKVATLDWSKEPC